MQAQASSGSRYLLNRQLSWRDVLCLLRNKSKFEQNYEGQSLKVESVLHLTCLTFGKTDMTGASWSYKFLC